MKRLRDGDDDEDDEDDVDFGEYPAKVVKIDDPEGSHRIRATIPGKEELTAWARPRGGGSAQRGGHVVPAVGADVMIRYLHGSTDHPVYDPGWWTKEEAPHDMQAAGVNAHLIQAFEVAAIGDLSFRVTLDERPGQRAFRIYAVDATDEEVIAMLELDLEKRGAVLYGLTGVDIRSDGFVWASAPVIQLNERVVLPRAGSI